MSTGLYDSGRNAFLNGAINYTSAGTTISCALIHNSTGGTSYAANLATDQFFTTATVPAGAVISSPVNLTSKTSTAGVAYCGNITFTAVPSGVGNQVDGILFYLNTGTPGSSQLIAYVDSAGVTAGGLPVVPNGSNITLSIPIVSPGLFKL